MSPENNEPGGVVSRWLRLRRRPAADPSASASAKSAAKQNETKDTGGNQTRFFGSQVGGKSVINYSYTDLPLKLLAWDTRYFFVFAWALPWIVWPATVLAAAKTRKMVIQKWRVCDSRGRW